MAQLVMRQNDTRPFLDATLLQGGDAVDLSNERVRFVMRLSDGTIKIDQSSTGPNVIIQAAGTSGDVQYQWQPGDLDTPGVLLAEFKVINLSSQQATFPNQGHIEINCNAELLTT